MILVEIAGFLGADPEERFTPTGKRVISFRVGTKDRKGGSVWWTVSLWGDRYDKMLPFLKKGSAVIVIGEMGKPETYTGKDGVVQVSLNLTAEILKFSPFGKGTEKGVETSHNSGSSEAYATAGVAAQESYGSLGDSLAGDDLPF